MRKYVFKTILSLLVIFCFVACSKDDNPANTETSPGEIEIEYKVTGSTELNPFKITVLHSIGYENDAVLVSQKEVTTSLPYSYKFKQKLKHSIRPNEWLTEAFLRVDIIGDYNDDEKKQKLRNTIINLEVFYNGKLAKKEVFHPSEFSKFHLLSNPGPFKK